MAKALAALKRDLAHGTDALIILICVALSAGIFILDLSSLPLGVAAGVAYVAVILLSLYLPGWQYTIFFAAGTSILTVVGFYAKEPAGSPWMVFANRALALAAIWLAAMAGIRLVHSRRKATEDVLRMQSTEHATMLRKAMQDADRARQARSRFLETANDYLRQRLQTLSLLNGTLRKVVTEASAQEIFALQHEEVAAVKRLLDSLLEITDLDSGDVEVELTETPIRDVFQRLQGEFRGMAQAKMLELQFDSEAETAFSDRRLLTLIIRNLIANAIRYTDRGTVKVSCRREADDLRITIEDSGIGIAPDQLTSIFDEFYRVETGSANRSGNFGLGLAIVERSATLLGTTLQVESAVGRGSTFSFLVPRVDAAGVELTVAG